MRARYVVDTNVLIAASAGDPVHPKDIDATPDDPALRAQVWDWLNAFQESDARLVLDLAGKIYDEYNHKLGFNDFGIQVVMHKWSTAAVDEGSPRDDKVLSPVEAAELLEAHVLVEEKLDGANLGFSIGPDGAVRAQNRGQYLIEPYGGQFARLTSWLKRHEERLFDGLGQHLIAFGEWCAAKHSLDYDHLPDWWLLFDIYDRQQGQFWSAQRRDAWAQQHGFVCVPRLCAGRVSLRQLQEMVLQQASAFRSGPLEGVVVRVDNAQWSVARAKLVRADFTQAIDTHWRSRLPQWNVLATCDPAR